MKTFSLFLASALFFVGSSVSAKDAGTLTVTQTSISPSSVPLGATRVAIDRLDLRASCDAPVTVRSITVHHKGLGALTDITKVYAMEKNIRLSRGFVLQKPAATAILRIPRFTLKPCETRTVFIAMDLSATAVSGGEHVVSVLSATDIATDATVSLQSKDTPSVLVTPHNLGTVSYTEIPLSSKNVLFGKGRTLLRFSLKADGAQNQLIDAITFTNDGKATDNDLRNLAVFTSNGEQVSATTDAMDGSLARITFSTPLLLSKNATRVFQLRGDVTASRRRTIELTVEETSDIESHTQVSGRPSVN